jgi:small GTP-binding protein
MQRLNISKGHAFMLVYSVTLRQSLDELIPIYKLIKEVKDGHDVPMILVGNKCDEEEARKIKKETGQKYVDELFKECSFIETSAKTNTNVQEAFQVNK